MSAYTLRSWITSDSNNRPKVVISLKRPAGVRPRAAAPIDGSVKCLVSLVLIAVLLLKFGFHAGSSSITYKFLSAFRYFANTSLSKVSSFEVQSSLNVSSDAAIEKRTLMNFDGLLYMLGSIPMFIVTIFLLLINAVFYLTKGMTTAAFTLNIVKYIVPTFLLPIFSGIVVMWMDKKPIKKMAKGLLLYPLFLGSWLLINFRCLFKKNVTWQKIEHTKSIKIDDKVNSKDKTDKKVKQTS